MIKKYSKIIKRSLFLAIIIILILVSYFIMIKYEVEGEKNLPFFIEKILVMSTVDGKPNTEAQALWDLQLCQNNDIYFYISRSQDSKDILKKVCIDNFKVTKTPKVGEIKIYRPTGELSNLYTYSEQNYINEKLEYTANVIDDLKTLEICNKGGVMALRIATESLGQYVSDTDSEMVYNASLLSKIGVDEEAIKYSISFDITIEIERGIKYKGTINLDLPAENLMKDGSASVELNNFENVIFKRIN